jgi:hypothetical protein
MPLTMMLEVRRKSQQHSQFIYTFLYSCCQPHRAERDSYVKPAHCWSMARTGVRRGAKAFLAGKCHIPKIASSVNRSSGRYSTRVFR